VYLRYPHIHGDQLAFVAEDDIWIVAADGGQARRLTADSRPASFPRFDDAGERLAWTSTREGAPEVYVTELGAPAVTRLTYWGEPSTRTIGWTADGQVLVTSAARQPFRFDRVAWTLPADGGPATQLPYGQVNDLSMAGGRVALMTARLSPDPASWKRYRGGTAGRLWVSDETGAGFTRLLADLRGQVASPMLIGGRLYFVSDHEGTGNIYSVTLEGQELRRHTDHDGFYARNPATDGTRIVYHLAGDIWLLDGDLDAPRRLDVTLGGPATALAPKLVTAASALGGLRTDETGQASAVEVRGTIHWLTHTGGPARALTVTQRARFPRVAGDRVFWVSDADGTDAIEYTAAEGSESVVRVTAEVGIVTGGLAASPDGATVASAAEDGKVYLTDVASGTVTEVAAGDNGESRGLAWSPDSEWLAWSQPLLHSLRKIRMVRRAGGEVLDVTDGRFADVTPVFTLDGKYLAFLSRRTFDPVYDAHTFDLSFPLGVRPYLAVLAAGTPSPFGPLTGGRPVSEEPASAEPGPLIVDPDGLASRVVGVPVEEARYSRLAAVDGGLAWMRSPVTGVLGEGGAEPGDDRPRPRLERFDLIKRSVSTVADELDWFVVSGDGKRLVVRDHEAVRVVPSGGESKSEPVTVDLSRARMTADPAELWRHAFDEYGRLVRSDYWTPDMSGTDWDEVLEAYRPLVEKVRGADDFADLLLEVAGELGTSHAYVRAVGSGGDGSPAPGLLGADLAQVTGRWVVSRVLPGESSDPLARSPLLAPGAGVGDGSEIVAVDGQPVDPVRGPWPLLAGTAGKPVELTVRSGEETRRVAIVPLKDERRLRYQDWVASRRAMVRSLGNGRLGYLHVPDMQGNGWAHFHRDLATEMSFEALLIDVRGNGGGHTSQLIVEKLARRVIAWDSGRYMRPSSYPQEAPRGPVIALTDEFAGSDGDIVTAAIKRLGLAPVVGARTWGGVIGIDGFHALADGTRVTIPRFAFWFDDLGWDVENHGVDPDVEVLRAPGSSGDVQLETAVRMALEALEKRPAAAPPVVPVPGAPSKARPPLPPRS
jgi:tricorn protease